MMSNEDYWKTKKFQKLAQQWNKKLAKSGLTDVENQHPEEPMLNTWDDHYFRRRFTAESALSRQDYYYIATQFLNTYKFESIRERKIWELHAEGLSFREIAQKLKIGKTTAHALFKKLKKACFGK